MSFIAFMGFQGVNSSTSLSSRLAPGWLLSSDGGETWIWVCLLELSSGPRLSDRGGALRLSLGGGADLSTGTCSTGGDAGSWSCARAAPEKHNQAIAKTR